MLPSPFLPLSDGELKNVVVFLDHSEVDGCINARTEGNWSISTSEPEEAWSLLRIIQCKEDVNRNPTNQVPRRLKTLQ